MGSIPTIFNSDRQESVKEQRKTSEFDYPPPESLSSNDNLNTDNFYTALSDALYGPSQSGPLLSSDYLNTNIVHIRQSDHTYSQSEKLFSSDIPSTEVTAAETVSNEQDHTIDSRSSDSTTGDLFKVKVENEDNTSSSEEKCFSFTCIKTDSQMQAMTGFDKNEFHAVYTFLNLECEHLGNESKNNINNFFLFLLKLKTGICNEFLSALFMTSCSSVSQIFSCVVSVLCEKLNVLIKWPDKKEIENNLPLEIQRSNIRVILDIVEFEIKSPKIPLQKQLTLNNQKNKNTFKALVGIALTGECTFISDLYCGSISNRDVVIESGILDKLENGDVVLAPNEFQIENELDEKGCILTHPVFSEDEIQFYVKKYESNQITVVSVDRAISRIQGYKYFEGPLSSTCVHNANEAFFITCMLTNFQNTQYIRAQVLTGENQLNLIQGENTT